MCVCVCVCVFQLSESGSASAIRAWMISQASLPYPRLKWESHSYCVPPPLIMFSNDSAKRRGIPAACHRPAQKCADGVITGAINAHHPQISCPTCAFLFVWGGRGDTERAHVCRPTNWKHRGHSVCSRPRSRFGSLNVWSFFSSCNCRIKHFLCSSKWQKFQCRDSRSQPSGSMIIK